MNKEELLIEAIYYKIPFLKDKLSAPYEKRIFSDSIDRNQFNRAIKILHDECGFYRAHHVIGIDDGDRLSFLYLLSGDDNIILALRESVPKSNPEVDSASWLYPAFLLHELELVDLFGAKIDGLPNRPHYPLPDGWPEGNYPMRKEWNPEFFDKKTMTYNEPENKAGEQE